MIQRFQSLYLLLASGSFGGTFMLPFAVSDQAAPGTILADQVFNVYDSTAMVVLFALAALVALAAIFLYTDRKLQVQLSWGALIAGVVGAGVGALAVMQDGEALSSIEVDEKLGIGLPLLGAVGSVLAARNIKKDEKFVRNADRLR